MVAFNYLNQYPEQTEENLYEIYLFQDSKTGKNEYLFHPSYISQFIKKDWRAFCFNYLLTILPN